LNIQVFYDETEYRLRSWRRVRNLIGKVIAEEGKISGDLNFILTNDNILKDLNLRFLKHNYFTDVISFGWGEGNLVEGEVYISVDTVKRNAENYKVSYSNEMIRVFIHGTLHLLGYNDKTKEEKDQMRRLEDWWLDMYKKI